MRKEKETSMGEVLGDFVWYNSDAFYNPLNVIKTLANIECVINCNCGNKSARTSK